MPPATGHLIWLTGLAGAGKSTVGRALRDLWCARKGAVVLLDGDVIRQLFGGERGYTLADRSALAMQYAGLCHLLTAQGIDVICATISMFTACREWCRERIPNYHEVYLKVPIEVLIQRDQHQLYSRASRGEVADVVGVNLPFEEPTNMAHIIEHRGDRTPQQVAEMILARISRE